MFTFLLLVINRRIFNDNYNNNNEDKKGCICDMQYGNQDQKSSVFELA